MEKLLTEFFQLEKDMPEVLKFLRRYEDTVEKLIPLLGVGHFFQGPDGTVFKTDVCLGKYHRFHPHEIKSTRTYMKDNGEFTKRTLSLPDAREAGFVVVDEKRANAITND